MKFFAVTPHLAFIRESHRLVLTWTHIADREVAAFTAVLTKDDLATLRDATEAFETQWHNADGLLRVHGSPERLVLTFREPGTEEHAELGLDGEERERFLSGVQALA